MTLGAATAAAYQWAAEVCEQKFKACERSDGFEKKRWRESETQRRSSNLPLINRGNARHQFDRRRQSEFLRWRFSRDEDKSCSCRDVERFGSRAVEAAEVAEFFVDASHRRRGLLKDRRLLKGVRMKEN